MTEEPQWLGVDERASWIALIALVTSLPTSLDSQMQRDAGMSYFEYSVLSRLSERDDRTVQMSELAAYANGSQSRLSHVARRLEARGLMRRKPQPDDGRITLAELTDAGMDAVRAAAPLHVDHVRRTVFDRIPPEQIDAFRDVLVSVLEGIDPGVAAMVTSFDPDGPDVSGATGGGPR